MPVLIAAVYVQDPATREEVILLPGQSPDPTLAERVTNPAAWQNPPDGGNPESIAVGEPDPNGCPPDGDEAGPPPATTRNSRDKKPSSRRPPRATSS